MDIRSSIVGIFAKTSSRYKFSGTGFFVEGGLILTCAHVAGRDKKPGEQVFFQFEGREAIHTATIEFYSSEEALDIAILKPGSLPNDVTPLPLAESKTSRGHKFSVFGYPQKGKFLGLHGAGDILGLVKEINGREALQFASSQVTYGYSGGPIVDETCQMVVGMVRGGLEISLNLSDKLGDTGFAVPTETLKAVYPELVVQPAKSPDPGNHSQIDVGGNVTGNIIVGHNNQINVVQPNQPFASIHQLPAPPADFVGRAEALAQILHQERTAISGLNGLGGVGKTALGLVAAWQLAESYPDAQFFIDLRGASQNPLAPPEAMRQVIRAFEPTADLRPYDDAQLQNLYRSLLNGKRALLFLDNARDAAQVRPLLPPPGCAVLVTSRAHFTLPGMSAPLRLDILPETDAVKLLTEICPRIVQHAANIAKLCGYLPLALRIAATFLTEHPDWTPAEYIERLEKQRLKTLKTEGDPAQDVEAVFELSYALLNADEQQQWRALSVFTAPFTRAALAAVCGLDADLARDLAGKLHRMSLLEFNADTARYFLHDLLRDFAAARLEPPQAFDAHQKHAEFFMQVAEQADDLYLEGGENLLHGLVLFDSEWAHIQAAQTWAAQELESGAAELAMLLPDVGAYLLDLRLPLREQIAWRETALRAARFLKNKNMEGTHLGNLGIVYKNLGEMRRAIEFYEQDLAIAREIGNRRGEGDSLGNLGNAYAVLGETRRAIEFYEQNLAIAREIGDRRGEGNSLGNLGIAYKNLGETRRAIEFYEQDLAIAREIGNRRGEGNALGSLGDTYEILGETRSAIEFYEQALAIAREIGDRRSEGADLGSLGIAHKDLGKMHRAIEFYEQALAIAREIGDRRNEGNWLGNLGVVYKKLGETRRAIEFYEQRLVIACEIGDQRGEGNALFNMGLACQELGDTARARQLGQQALEIFLAIEDPHAPMVKEWLEGLGV